MEPKSGSQTKPVCGPLKHTYKLCKTECFKTDIAIRLLALTGWDKLCVTLTWLRTTAIMTTLELDW